MLRALAGVLLALLIAGGCAKRPVVVVRPEAQPPSARAEPEPTPQPAQPFTDEELADRLAKEGVGVPKEGPTTAKPGEELPTEIRRTPRGVVITFRHVLFAFDSSDLGPRARLEVERMARVLNHPQAINRHVVLEGHTDSIGSDAYNLDLSRRRAETVAQELIARGVRRDRVAVEGYGKHRPVAPNRLPNGHDNPAGRALNRRVEAVVQIQGAAR